MLEEGLLAGNKETGCGRSTAINADDPPKLMLRKLDHNKLN